MLCVIDNPASETGPQRFKWWPDWRGKYAAVIACGPSAKSADLSPLKDRVKVIAIKEAYDLAPFADVVYGCDYPWWEFRRGLPQFNGLKLSWDPRTPAAYPGVQGIQIRDKTLDLVTLDQPGSIGSGRNSGFQALNLAAQFGAKGIALIGFDMTARDGVHFYGRNNWANSNNPDHSSFHRWLQAFGRAAPMLRDRGFDIVNCSPRSVLECFRRSSIEQALAAWGV